MGPDVNVEGSANRPSKQREGDASDKIAEHVHEGVAARPWFRRVMQVGWIAKGVVYASLGWAAIEISLAKTAADDAEYDGIVTSLADGSITRVLLAVIAIGLLFYIAFRLISVALIDDDDLDAWAHRIAYTASAFTYITVSWAAANAVVKGANDSGESSIERYSTQMLESQLGRVVLAVAGTGAVAVAVYFVFKGVTRRFMSQIESTDMSDAERKIIELTGSVGWVGRGLTVAVVALFITWAAIDADPGDVRGIDSSMHRVANEPVGQALVMALGISLIVYASYCILSFRRRRLAWDDNAEPASETDNELNPTPQRSAQ